MLKVLKERQSKHAEQLNNFVENFWADIADVLTHAVKKEETKCNDEKERKIIAKISL